MAMMEAIRRDAIIGVRNYSLSRGQRPLRPYRATSPGRGGKAAAFYYFLYFPRREALPPGYMGFSREK